MDRWNHKQWLSDNCIYTARKSYKCQNEYSIYSHFPLFTFRFFFFIFLISVSFKNIVSNFGLLKLLDCVKIRSFIFALKTVNLDCKHKHHYWPSHGCCVINNRYWLHHLIQVHRHMHTLFSVLIQHELYARFMDFEFQLSYQTRKWAIILPYPEAINRYDVLLFTQRTEQLKNEWAVLCP